MSGNGFASNDFGHYELSGVACDPLTEKMTFSWGECVFKFKPPSGLNDVMFGMVDYVCTGKTPGRTHFVMITGAVFLVLVILS